MAERPGSGRDKPRRFRFGDAVEPLRASLLAGGVAAIPTESSYGIAVDPRSEVGVERVFALKGRDRDKPLPVVIAGVAQAVALGIDEDAPLLRWAAARWPAALTVLLPVARPLPAMAGGATLGVRVPDHEPLVDLLARLGFGLTATSANRSGAPPILRSEELDSELGDALDWVVDGGVLPGGAPSTVVSSGADVGAEGLVEVLRHGRFRLTP